jgi:hypothetical protein
LFFAAECGPFSNRVFAAHVLETAPAIPPLRGLALGSACLRGISAVPSGCIGANVTGRIGLAADSLRGVAATGAMLRRLTLSLDTGAIGGSLFAFFAEPLSVFAESFSGRPVDLGSGAASCKSISL